MSQNHTCHAAPLIAEFARTGTTPKGFEALVHERGDGPLGTAVCYWHFPDEGFDVSRLGEDDIPDDRYDELCAGAQPTRRELELWRQAIRDLFFETGDGPGGNGVDLWQLADDDGVPMWAVTAREDGGSWAEVFGPYPTAETALEDLQRRADVEEVDWPVEPPPP